MKPRAQATGAAGEPATSGLPPVGEPPRSALGDWVHAALFDNLGLKFLSMVLAVTVFLLVNTDQDREITVRVGVNYDYPADKVLTSERIAEVRVTLKGPWRRLRRFDERELNRINLDLATAPTGQVAFTPSMVTTLPPGLTVMSFNPPAVQVAFDRRIVKTVEVTPVTGGRPQHGYVAVETKAIPATVRIHGGERLLAALTTIRTSEVSLENRIDTFEVHSELAPPVGVTVDPGQRVTVFVRIDEELVTRKLPSVPVAVRGDGVDPARWAVDPASVEVTLTGALLAIDLAKDRLTAVVKLTAADARSREVEVTLDGVPPSLGKRVSPERVRVVPVKPAAPTSPPPAPHAPPRAPQPAPPTTPPAAPPPN